MDGDGTVEPVSCLFCKILAGEIPSTEVLSTENTYAFRDINAGAPTHVLVIPREHIENADVVGPEQGALLAEMFTTAQAVARQEGIHEGGYRLIFNVGDDTGNSVPHLHLHVMGGRRMGWPPG
jgi:histidine triad (HIT) family protein